MTMLGRVPVSGRLSHKANFVADSPPAWDWLAAKAGYKVAWWAKDADALLMRATNPYVAEGRQILIDGDMETSGVAAWTAGGLTLTKNTSAPHSGAQNLRLTATGTGSKSASQAVTVIGKAYHVTGWAKGDGTVAPRLASSGIIWTGTTSTSWQAFDFYFIAAATSLGLNSAFAVTGFIEFDDLTLKQVNIRASTDYPSATGRLNIVTNTDMDFDYAFSGTNWAWSSGGYVHTPGATTNLAQTVAATVIGKTYDYEIVVVGRTTGDVTVKLGTTGAGSAHAGNGTFNGSNITAAGTAGVYITPSSGFDGRVTINYVKPHDDLLLWDGVATAANWTAVTAGTITNPSTGVLRIARNASNDPEYQQLATVIGRRYRLTGEYQGDGSATPRVRDGTTTRLTGTTATSWVAFDTPPFIAVSNSLRLGSVTSTGSQYTEWRNLVLVEINPLDELHSVPPPVLTSGQGAALGDYALDFDGVNDFGNLYSPEFNSVIDPTEFMLNVVVRVDDVANWNSASLTFFARVTVLTNTNDIRIYKPSANVLSFQYAAGGTIKTINVTGVTDTGYMLLSLSVSKSGDFLKAYVNGVQVGSTQTGLGTWTGNLAATIVIIGAGNTSGGFPSDGFIAFAGWLNDPHDAAFALKFAAILGVLP